MKTKKSQGEIFGIALMFVVIIIGILVYGKIKALNPDNSINEKTEGKYKILAEGTLNSILKMSTSCPIQRNQDRVLDLIDYCITNSYKNNPDPKVICYDENGIEKKMNSCSYVIEIFNSTLQTIFEKENLGEIPFKLSISLVSDKDSILNTNLTNFGNVTFRNKIINESGSNSYRKLGFKRAPSGLRTWATAKRNIDFELYLYYR